MRKQGRHGEGYVIRWLWVCAVLLLAPLAVQAEMPSEANIKAVVGDAAKLMAAKTPLDALGALKEIRTCIELPDIVFDPQVKLDGTMLLGVNVLARLGVLGNPIPLPATAESVAKLATMKVEVLDQTGALLASGKGSDSLENPLNAALWIAESLRGEGKAVKNGDLLSLGSFSALLPPKSGMTVTIRYTGLTPEPTEVKVTFE